VNWTGKADDVGDNASQFANADDISTTNVDDFFGGIALHQKDHGIRSIVHMQKFPPRGTSAPNLNRPSACLGLQYLADHGRHHVAGDRINIVSGSVKIGRNNAYKVAFVLTAIGPAQAYAGKLGQCIGFIRRFQRSGHQLSFGHRLCAQSRINAGGTEKHQFLNAAARSGVDDIDSNGYIVVGKIRRPGQVRLDASDTGRGDEYRLRPRCRHPRLDITLTRQIEFGTVDRKQRAAAFFKAPHQSRPDHAVMPGHPNSLAAQFKALAGFTHS
jgi:hypothetical protein